MHRERERRLNGYRNTVTPAGHNTLTQERTQSLGLCHNTLTGKYTEIWAVPQHTDARKKM